MNKIVESNYMNKIVNPNYQDPIPKQSNIKIIDSIGWGSGKWFAFFLFFITLAGSHPSSSATLNTLYFLIDSSLIKLFLIMQNLPLCYIQRLLRMPKLLK